MSSTKCTSCGYEFAEWVEFCPNCAAPVAGYARPAGFWIRVGAQIIDSLVFLPIAILSFWNMFSVKSMILLVFVSLPGLIYKPFMESFYGATLGKMACGIKVIDESGNRVSLPVAYARFFPFLLQGAIGLVSMFIIFSSPQFESVKWFTDLAQVQQGDFLRPISMVMNIVVFVDCVVVAFTFRKRALHDMLAETFCVFNEPRELNPQEAGAES